MTLYHIDRVLAAHGWVCTSVKPRQYTKGTTVLTCNRSGVTDVNAPSGPLEPFIPALYAPLAAAGQMLKLI
jgi:hypothetical protein